MEQDSQKREAEETEFHAASIPTLCANNCGFFGSSATNNLCSKCYKDAFLSKSKGLAVEAIAVAPAAPTPVTENSSVEVGVEENKNKKLCGEEGEANTDAGVAVVGKPFGESSAVKKPANRCNFCNKRVGLMGFKCRCGEVFCSLHRYSDKHNCAFDYRGAGQDAIAKANPIVKVDKMEKI